MPRYGEFKYGRIEKYGRYNLSSGGSGYQPGKHIRFRIRLHANDGSTSDYLIMHDERISIPAPPNTHIRMRANGGEWVYTQQELIPGNPYQIRIRSISSSGETSEWVQKDQGALK